MVHQRCEQIPGGVIHIGSQVLALELLSNRKLAVGAHHKPTRRNKWPMWQRRVVYRLGGELIHGISDALGIRAEHLLERVHKVGKHLWVGLHVVDGEREWRTTCGFVFDLQIDGTPRNRKPRMHGHHKHGDNLAGGSFVWYDH